VSERRGPIHGLFGRPYADLSYLVDDATLDAIDEEIGLGLVHADATYTGGTLKWMGVVAPWVLEDGYDDAMDVVRGLGASAYETFLSLAEPPCRVESCPQASTVFGDETDRPFSRAQLDWLTMRHGAYFPWKVCVHLLANDRWDDKHLGAGKAFEEEAVRLFPRTVALIRQLPFSEIGRVVIFGVAANDHAPLHRDSEPGRALAVAQSITLAPGRKKRFFLCNHQDDEPLVVAPRVYWFNDMDYHGVLPDPYFRYSIRVDGCFEPAFLRELEARLRRPTSVSPRSRPGR
jgi:hypothetical protein